MKMIEKVGLIIAIVSGVLTITYPKEIYNYFYPGFSSASTNSELYGCWASNYGYSVNGGAVHVDGVVNYFKTGDYNFSGTVGMTANKGGHSLTFSYTVSGAGAWMADRNSLVIKLQDTKSSIKSIDFDAKSIKPQAFEALTKQKVPEFTDALPKGTAGEFQIVNVTHDAVKLRARDPLGHIFSVTMTRLNDSLTSL